MVRKLTRKKLIICIVSVLLALSLTAGGFLIYTADYYKADMSAIDAYRPEGAEYTEREIGSALVFEPESSRFGFIFYPGGKVEYTAYVPLMRALAARGILAVLIEMPFNLAVLDMNAADGYTELFPDISGWFIGGHSLGGSMAASYAAKHSDEFDGVVLLGAYSTASLTELSVLSVYGENDGVMNRKKYEKYKSNLPSDFTEYEIAGGNHAGFGMYGNQSGDGIARTDSEEQIELCSFQIFDFITKGR